jgi:hypothetical protein
LLVPLVSVLVLVLLPLLLLVVSFEALLSTTSMVFCASHGLYSYIKGGQCTLATSHLAAHAQAAPG